MKTLRLLTAISFLLALPLSAEILVKIPGMGDPGVTIQGYNTGEWFVADSFNFGVDRVLPSGEHGGTEDINIGVAELGLCTLTKALNRASARLMQVGINGNSPGQAEIHFVQIAQGGAVTVYLKYKLDRCFVKSWSTSGDANNRPKEEVAFYYNRIALLYTKEPDGSTVPVASGLATWDRITNTQWSAHGLTP